MNLDPVLILVDAMGVPTGIDLPAWFAALRAGLPPGFRAADGRNVQ